MIETNQKEGDKPENLNNAPTVREETDKRSLTNALKDGKIRTGVRAGRFCCWI